MQLSASSQPFSKKTVPPKIPVQLNTVPVLPTKHLQGWSMRPTNLQGCPQGTSEPSGPTKQLVQPQERTSQSKTSRRRRPISAITLKAQATHSKRYSANMIIHQPSATIVEATETRYKPYCHKRNQRPRSRTLTTSRNSQTIIATARTPAAQQQAL